MSLTQYKKKRNFKKTPEPQGGRKGRKKALTFVVQRHKASHLHYDFRLEMDGVLKSWAVPKGPSMNPGDKRLAMMVEDHPLDYAHFEGVIPEPNYGAGIVEIWDEGTYEDLSEKDVAKREQKLLSDLKKGSLKFVLKGKKLQGEFALVKMKTASRNSWLLLKHKDKFAVSRPYDSEKQTDPGSPINKALREEDHSKQPRRRSKPAQEEEEPPAAAKTSGQKYADFIHPMLVRVAPKPFSDPAWLFEIKWDGYRAIAELGSGTPKLYSRNGISFVEKYAPVTASLKKMHQKLVLDGEIVVMDEHDRPSFQKLQDYSRDGASPIFYYVFDLLYYRGKSIMNRPLSERKELLRKVLKEDDVIRYCDHVAESGEDFFKVAVEKDLEGIMAKKADSVYKTGRRSEDWLKIRNSLDVEAVIAGFTRPRGSRKHFGALILGMYHDDVLEYVGHTGTGFDEKTLRKLYEKMLPLVRERSPFGKKIPVNNPATWLRPELVCNIRFTEWTKDGSMRHPVYQGLRIDKTAHEVKKEEQMPTVPDQRTTKKKAAAKKAASQNDQITKKAGRQNQKLMLTHLDKIFWPEEKITKGDVINYYSTISRYILPHLKGRPQSLKRNPNGITDKGFFHKDAGDAAPAWIDTVEIYSESNDKEVNYIVCNSKDALLYLANLGCIELNPWNSRVEKLDFPDYLILDIDPSEKNDYDDVVEVAKAVKSVLDKAKAVSFAKTSGATGMHVYVPLGARYSYEQARTFAELVATLAQEQVPEISTLERSIRKRGKDKIYIDYLQNARGQTLACAYSLRPRPGATVSTPLKWTEVKKGLRPSAFNIRTVPSRIAKTGDLFRDVLRKGNDLQKCLAALDR